MSPYSTYYSTEVLQVDAIGMNIATVQVDYGNVAIKVRV